MILPLPPGSWEYSLEWRGHQSGEPWNAEPTGKRTPQVGRGLPRGFALEINIFLCLITEIWVVFTAELSLS